MNRNSDLNFQIDLLPVISLLAVIISFLLVTAVWIHIGTLDVSQAIGEETNRNNKNPPSVTAKFSNAGDLIISVNDAPSAPRGLRNVRIGNRGGQIDWEAVENYAFQLKEKVPDVNTALIMPKANSPYADIIRLMDKFRKHEYRDIGISPL